MKQILVINTKLYGDEQKVKTAVEAIEENADIKWIELDPVPTADAFWDSLVEELLAADRIISI